MYVLIPLLETLYHLKQNTVLFLFSLAPIAYMELYIKLGQSRALNSPPTNIFP